MLKNLWFRAFYLLLTGAASLPGPAMAATGEYWEMTSKMEMPGMPFAMPATTVKVCVPKGQERDPQHGADKDCVVSDVRNSGNKTSWKVQCNTKDGVMTGVGESSGTPDNMEGKVRLTGTSGGQKIDMTQTYKNKRIGGACDPDEMKKMVKEAQAAGEKNLAQMCDTTKYTTQQWLGSSSLFLGEKPTCVGKKEAFCAVVKRDVTRNPTDYYYFTRGDTSKISAACGMSPETTKRSVCSSLDAGNSGIRKQLESREVYRLMQSECPGEMKTYAEASRKRYCEGRNFTARQQMSMEQCMRSTGESDEAMEEPAEPAAPAARAKRPSKTTTAGQTAETPAEEAPAPAAPSSPSTPSAPSNPLGLPSIPGLPDLPGNANPAGAILEGAKKLKGLFGF